MQEASEWTRPVVSTRECAMDDKGRILLPSKFRSWLGADFVVYIGPVGCLCAVSQSEWAETVARLVSGDITDSARQALARIILASAEDELNCDPQGRLCIPKRLRDWAGLEGDVLLLGCGRLIEIWVRREYERFLAEGEAYNRSRRRTIEEAYARLRSSEN